MEIAKINQNLNNFTLDQLLQYPKVEIPT
jgi:hypothetical protein